MRQEPLLRMQSSTQCDEHGTDFLGNSLKLGYTRKQFRSSNSFVAMVFFFPKLWTKAVSAGNGTGADDDNKKQVDPLKKGKEKGKKQTPKPERNSHKQHKQHKHQHPQELW